MVRRFFLFLRSCSNVSASSYVHLASTVQRKFKFSSRLNHHSLFRAAAETSTRMDRRALPLRSGSHVNQLLGSRALRGECEREGEGKRELTLDSSTERYEPR